jgi:hypothetical protein
MLVISLISANASPWFIVIDIVNPVVVGNKFWLLFCCTKSKVAIPSRLLLLTLLLPSISKKSSQTAFGAIL